MSPQEKAALVRRFLTSENSDDLQIAEQLLTKEVIPYLNYYELVNSAGETGKSAYFHIYIKHKYIVLINELYHETGIDYTNI